MKKITATQLRNEIIRTEKEINDDCLKDGDRKTSQHREMNRMLKEFKKTKTKIELYDFLDSIGFDYQDASDYLLNILVNWKK
jgi:hypothetical protein